MRTATTAAAAGIVAAAVVLVVLVLVLAASHHPAVCTVHQIPNWPGSPKWLQQSGHLTTVNCP